MGFMSHRMKSLKIDLDDVLAGFLECPSQFRQEYIEPEEDSLRFYRLCENCVVKVETFRIMDQTQSPDLVII